PWLGEALALRLDPRVHGGVEAKGSKRTGHGASSDPLRRSPRTSGKARRARFTRGVEERAARMLPLVDGRLELPPEPERHDSGLSLEVLLDFALEVLDCASDALPRAVDGERRSEELAHGS